MRKPLSQKELSYKDRLIEKYFSKRLTSAEKKDFSGFLKSDLGFKARVENELESSRSLVRLLYNDADGSSPILEPILKFTLMLALTAVCYWFAPEITAYVKPLISPPIIEDSTAIDPMRIVANRRSRNHNRELSLGIADENYSAPDYSYDEASLPTKITPSNGSYGQEPPLFSSEHASDRATVAENKEPEPIDVTPPALEVQNPPVSTERHLAEAISQVTQQLAQRLASVAAEMSDLKEMIQQEQSSQLPDERLLQTLRVELTRASFKRKRIEASLAIAEKDLLEIDSVDVQREPSDTTAPSRRYASRNAPQEEENSFRIRSFEMRTNRTRYVQIHTIDKNSIDKAWREILKANGIPLKRVSEQFDRSERMVRMKLKLSGKQNSLGFMKNLTSSGLVARARSAESTQSSADSTLQTPQVRIRSPFKRSDYILEIYKISAESEGPYSADYNTQLQDFGLTLAFASKSFEELDRLLDSLPGQNDLILRSNTLYLKARLAMDYREFDKARLYVNAIKDPQNLLFENRYRLLKKALQQ